jgi:hypothetical protein
MPKMSPGRSGGEEAFQCRPRQLYEELCCQRYEGLQSHAAENKLSGGAKTKFTHRVRNKVVGKNSPVPGCVGAMGPVALVVGAGARRDTSRVLWVFVTLPVPLPPEG